MGGVINFEDLSWDVAAVTVTMSTESKSESRRDVRNTVNKIREDLTHASKDLASAGKTWAESTTKFVREVSPKVATTIDESLAKASETFNKTMSQIDSQTKPQQVKLLTSYRSFLSKQVDMIEKRLKKIKE